MRDFLRQFMLYSRSERRAVVALVVLILGVIAIPKAYQFYIAKKEIRSISPVPSDIAQWQKQDSDTSVISASSDTSHVAGQNLFYFDPNTIGIADWQRLGLSEKQATSIEKYKSRGGRFRRPDDLRRLYALSDEEKERLVPFVRISGSDGAEVSDSKPAKAATPHIIEINTADSATFESLYGIGPALSSRIVRYRSTLGGFVRVEQIAEVYGIRDSVYMDIRPQLRVDASRIQQISVNDADYETMRSHPYIHAKIAHAIIAYRDTKGRITSGDQLRQIRAVTPEAYERLLPYLSFR